MTMVYRVEARRVADFQVGIFFHTKTEWHLGVTKLNNFVLFHKNIFGLHTAY